MTYNVGLVSLGCDKNRVDAEVMLSTLAMEGYKIVSDPKEADIIIVNTCGFIEAAKTESIETILEMAENKKDGKCKAVIVTGCMAQRYRDELLKEMPEIDAIVGTGSYREICDIIEELTKGNRGIIRTGELNYKLDYERRIITTPVHYAYVKIAEGCNNNCTYCIIPQLRGRFRSRTMESIVTEIEGLAESGVREIILVAQDTTMYGVDIYGKKMISTLLKEIEKVEDIKWIRIMYSYPEEITDELIETVKYSSKVCHYFDIPLQHISNNILRRMNRRSTTEDIKLLINKLRLAMPDCIIRTSLIVGFPGETEEDFYELYDFLKEFRLDRVGIFTYSQEEGTLASGMPDQIEDNVKEKRKDKLMKLQRGIALSKNKALIGKTIKVIIDGKGENNKYLGRSYGDAPEIDQQVIVNADNAIIKSGEIVNVNITDNYTYDLVGDVTYEPCK